MCPRLPKRAPGRRNEDGEVKKHRFSKSRPPDWQMRNFLGLVSEYVCVCSRPRNRESPRRTAREDGEMRQRRSGRPPGDGDRTGRRENTVLEGSGRKIGKCSLSAPGPYTGNCSTCGCFRSPRPGGLRAPGNWSEGPLVTKQKEIVPRKLQNEMKSVRLCLPTFSRESP